jgi:hypothetical protein
MPSIRRSDTVLLIVLTSFVALVLFWVGAGPALADPPVCGDGVCQGNEPRTCPQDCDGGGGGGGGGGEYDVTVSGDLSPKAGSLPDYDGEDGAGNMMVKVFFQPLDLDLSFFFGKFGVLGREDRGTKCFSDAPVLDNFPGMQIFQENDGSATVGYWFTGYGDDGTTEINYVLWMFGDFGDPDNWRPASGTSNSVDLMAWEMTTKSRKNRNISCRDEIGLFTDDPGQTINLVRTN